MLSGSNVEEYSVCCDRCVLFVDAYWSIVCAEQIVFRLITGLTAPGPCPPNSAKRVNLLIA